MCIFDNDSKPCNICKQEWSDSEYKEELRISKRDRAFLEYVKDCYKYMARDMSGEINVYQNKPHDMIDIWYDKGKIQNISSFNVDFPMVKWEDKKPWLIEDLKKLEVTEKYV